MGIEGMRRLAAVFGALSITGAPLAAFAQTPPPITKAEVRSLPEAEVRTRVMDQLEALLTENEFSSRRPPTRRLDHLALRAKPRAIEVPGLCEVDELQLTFAAGRRREGDQNTPVSVDGFTSRRYFHFLRVPLREYDRIDNERDSAADNGRCRELDFWNDDFFAADDARTATDGYLLARRTIAAVIAGDEGVSLTCEKFASEANLTCADLIRELQAAHVSSVTTCQAAGPRFAACYDLDIGDRLLRVVGTGYIYGDRQPQPLTPVSAHIASLVIIADSIID